MDGAGEGLIPANGNLIFHVGSNKDNRITLEWTQGFTISGIAAIDGTINIASVAAAGANKGMYKDASTNSHAYFDIRNQCAANNVIALIDSFVQAVDSKRADLGAIQNRMEATIRNQANISENESDARSRIRDTDFASETAALTQNNIIQQASQTVLAQANQRPTIALSLLGS